MPLRSTSAYVDRSIHQSVIKVHLKCNYIIPPFRYSLTRDAVLGFDYTLLGGTGSEMGYLHGD